MQQFVILSDYGGPERDDQVVPYLYQLFRDRRILNLPTWFRIPLAWLISRLRGKKARKLYRAIGGSPVNQTVATICTRLNQMQQTFRFVPGFQYIRPRLADVARALAGTGPVLVIPTFPHDSFSTYGSIRDRVAGLASVRVARSYAEDPTFVDLLADRVREALGEWEPDDTVVLCTAHSIPVSFVRRGDGYVDEVRRQVALLANRLAPYRLELAFQSPLGPVEWVGPILKDRFRELVEEGVKRIVVAPLSFTVDNSETLFELDQDLAAYADTIGLAAYRRVSCMNDDDRFLSFLLDRAHREWKTLTQDEMEGSR